MLRFAILFTLLSILPLRANLGETIAQCVARYGRPAAFSEASSKFPFGTVVFSAGGYTLIIFLVKETEVGARVSKQDKSAFTDTEIQNILLADAGASPWVTAKSTDPTCLQWNRADQATALYDKDKHVLIFTSKEMADAVKSAPSATAPVPAPAPAH